MRASGGVAMQAVPLVAMALLAVLFGVLLWLLQTSRAEEERTTLIKDILWVEQNLHLHLDSDEQRLARLAEDLGHGIIDAAAFADAAGELLGNDADLERVSLVDIEGVVTMARPPQAEAPIATDRPGMTAFALARSVGKPVYSAAFHEGRRGWVFELYVPVFDGHRFAGAVVGEIAVDKLLATQVPWWVAQRYKIEIVDDNGTVLGGTSRLEVAEPGPSHQVRFDPPGHGLSIVATLHPAPSDLSRNVIAASIFGLALLSAWSLWSARRQQHRRLAAERALGVEHAYRKAMEDSLTVGMRARDLDGRITYVNPAFCRMVGRSAEELVGAVPPMPYWLPDELEQTYAIHRMVMRGEAPAEGFEIRFRRKNGEVFWALIYEAPLIEASGEHVGWMASVLDITERKSAEELARQQQERMQRAARLTSMGEMASTLAHELNQPLSAIASYNTGCLNRLASGAFTADELTMALGKLGAQAQRAGQIIRRIHDFVRKREPRLELCSINALVADALAFIAADAKKRGVAIDFAAAEGDPPVNADRILIEQVLVNLVRNGMEAMGAADKDDRQMSVGIAVDGAEATVTVADRGCGVAPERVGELFQPFFTTKAEGMGMGLNICRSIIEFHQGRLWFEPNPGGGSIFRFTLPRVSP